MKMTAVLAVAALSVTASMAQAIDPAARPAGVEEKDWILISERLGFVLDQNEPQPSVNQSRQILLAPPENVSAEIQPPAKGYFVVKTPAGWRRIAVSE